MPKVALITGATGIVGSAIIDHLIQNTHRDEWSKIIGISRREPFIQQHDDRFVFLPIDLNLTEEEIKNKLLDGGADDVTHVFYTAYVHDKKWDPNNLYQKNVPMFKNFIKAIDSIAPLERIELQTGCKYYGIHKGNCPSVIDDSTPRYKEEPNAPDFYFGQEDFLTQFAQGKKWKYTIYRPNDIVGVTRGNGMSIAPTLAVYFTIQKYLGQKAAFPGNEVSYRSILDVSSNDIIANFAVWTSQKPEAENNDFIIIDHDSQHLTGEQLWKGIADFFGVPVEEPSFAITGSKPKEYSLTEYMKDKRDLWKEIATKYGIEEQTFDFCTFEFVGKYLYEIFLNGADAVLSFSWPQHFRMPKAKQIGWRTERNHLEGFIQAFEKMKKWKMIPSL